MLPVAWVNALIYEMATRRRPAYDGEAARRLAQASGWTMAPGWRRIPSRGAVARAKAHHRTARHPPIDGRWRVRDLRRRGWHSAVPASGRRMRGVEAVIDKDFSAALLATALEVDGLVLLTDGDAVYIYWATAEARRIKPQRPPNCGSS